MKKNARMKRSPEFKAKVALAAIREQATVAEIARQFHLNANIVHKWKGKPSTTWRSGLDRRAGTATGRKTARRRFCKRAES
jgi:transposase-like protein